ncbi:MAG: hypothetical protein JWR68_486 [Polaromonas sp.]|nr:hypothetical protein [Polaromonas sp.]
MECMKFERRSFAGLIIAACWWPRIWKGQALSEPVSARATFNAGQIPAALHLQKAMLSQ